MRYEVNVGRLGGFAGHSAAPGQQVAVCVRGFFTPDDGRDFYGKMEAIENLVLAPYLEAGGLPATISHLLALIDGEKAQVFVNEPPMAAQMVARRALKAGEPIYRKDIGGIGTLRFLNLEIAPTSAIIFYFSIAWRRGLFFDLQPLRGGSLGDIERVLGECYDRLWFSDLYSIPNELWPTIFGTGWFPFMKLIGGTFEELPGFLERGILSTWEGGVLAQFTEAHIRELVDGWRNVAALREHIPFAEKALDRYAADDSVSAISILWPRIEGVLRHLYLGPEERPGQRKLLAHVRDILEKKAVTPASYLPGLFEQYLLRFYFRDFNLKEDHVELGRHSLAHGVTKVEEYNQRRVLQGFLILDQLACYAKLGWVENEGAALPQETQAPVESRKALKRRKPAKKK